MALVKEAISCFKEGINAKVHLPSWGDLTGKNNWHVDSQLTRT
jgi:hypothetical protein